MSNTQKRYTPEFKQRAVELLAESDATAAEVARDLGIDPSTLRKWARDIGGCAQSAAKGQNPFQLQEDLKRLRKENAHLKKENEILLKASAFFASKQM